jgi:hypothetical protein
MISPMRHMGNSGKTAIGAFAAAAGLLVLTAYTLEEVALVAFPRRPGRGVRGVGGRSLCQAALPCPVGRRCRNQPVYRLQHSLPAHVGAGLQPGRSSPGPGRDHKGFGHLLLPGRGLGMPDAAGVVLRRGLAVPPAAAAGRTHAGHRHGPACRYGQVPEHKPGPHHQKAGARVHHQGAPSTGPSCREASRRRPATRPANRPAKASPADRHTKTCRTTLFRHAYEQHRDIGRKQAPPLSPATRSPRPASGRC